MCVYFPLLRRIYIHSCTTIHAVRILPRSRKKPRKRQPEVCKSNNQEYTSYIVRCLHTTLTTLRSTIICSTVTFPSHASCLNNRITNYCKKNYIKYICHFSHTWTMKLCFKIYRNTKRKDLCISKLTNYATNRVTRLVHTF